jgi:hypothetical protein
MAASQKAVPREAREVAVVSHVLTEERRRPLEDGDPVLGRRQNRLRGVQPRGNSLAGPILAAVGIAPRPTPLANLVDVPTGLRLLGRILDHRLRHRGMLSPHVAMLLHLACSCYTLHNRGPRE